MAEEVIRELELLKKRSRLMALIGGLMLIVALVMALMAMLSFPNEIQVYEVHSLDEELVKTIQEFIGVPNSYRVYRDFELNIENLCNQQVRLSVVYSGSRVEKLDLQPYVNTTVYINRDVVMMVADARPGCSLKVRGIAVMSVAAFQWLSIPAFLLMFVGAALLLRGTATLLKMKAEGF
ncbi:MAG: hypothetical protein DRO12_02635 [Thermoprotei archaeon]|nr:MAG: hypothetical protein DRO12_02635 [Thermoprotei archaeon]